MSSVAISVDKVTKRFGDFLAVDELSFDVYGGEIFALLGPNGAGKSTTIRMILDILRPNSGQIAVLGGPITEKKKDRIGYLPEERGLYRNIRVIDMMVYLGTLKGMRASEARRRALALLEELDLPDHANSKVQELSKGMQQKVQFAVTVMHNPELIIIDEPFSGLDPLNRLVIRDLLLRMRNQGVAIVMSTHQMNQVEELADRMLMIDKGQQKLYGGVNDIRAQYAEHAIIVDGEGDWAALPGVASVKSNGRAGIKLYLKPDVQVDDVLAAIAQNDAYSITRFERAIPSLDEIFVRVVGGDDYVENAQQTFEEAMR
ncbi:MAG: ATP-binding cassette domain-containing protein [Chloroflexi bacterium]|nr:MAG: ATP-binding cassette domain-containing protein [Chloroflexota bacterium]